LTKQYASPYSPTFSSFSPFLFPHYPLFLFTRIFFCPCVCNNFSAMLPLHFSSYFLFVLWKVFRENIGNMLSWHQNNIIMTTL
jgi:hypothetical protein